MHSLGAKRAATLAGTAALVALIASAVNLDNQGSPTVVAGSGDAPTNTQFTQPSLNAMTMGASATWTTPGSVEATTLASPVIKAGK